MSKGRRRPFNPGKSSRNKLACKSTNPSRKQRLVRKKWLSQLTLSDIRLKRQMRNMSRLEDVQNALSSTNFAIANCKEIIAGIQMNGDRTSRAFGVELEKDLIRYHSLKERHSIHLKAIMGYGCNSRIPRMRGSSTRMNELFKRRMKKNLRQKRSTRMDSNMSLNVDDIQASDTKLMMENERDVQGLESIVMAEYDNQNTEGESFELETLKRRKRKRKAAANGARGMNVVETFDWDDVFNDCDVKPTRYQFAFDLKGKDKHSIGEHFIYTATSQSYDVTFVSDILIIVHSYYFC